MSRDWGRPGFPRRMRGSFGYCVAEANWLGREDPSKPCTTSWST